MFRLDYEYGLYFNGSTWKLKGKIKPYKPDRSKFSQSTPKLDLVDTRNEKMFGIKVTGMADILEVGLRSKYDVVINDDTQTWYLEESSKC
jgi:hypothetical protein